MPTSGRASRPKLQPARPMQNILIPKFTAMGQFRDETVSFAVYRRATTRTRRDQIPVAIGYRSSSPVSTSVRVRNELTNWSWLPVRFNPPSAT